MPITITPYNPTWPQIFQNIKQRLETHLRFHAIPYLLIEHIGSTSVPGLAAKPCIDIDIIVTRANVQPAVDALCKYGGFMYLGECGIANRHAVHDPEQEPSRNIYVCVEGTVAVRNHVGLRDTLRKDEALRDEYARVKRELAEREGITIDEYVEGKSAVIQWILKEARMLSEEELGAVKQANERSGRVSRIETKRLVLREFVMGDVDALWRLEGQEEVVRYQVRGPMTRERARKYVADLVRDSFAVPRSVVELAVTCDGNFIGRVGAKITGGKEEGGDEKERRHVSLWFSFGPEWQGKGLATEAMDAFLPVLGSHALLEIECDPRNAGSVNMAKRLGFSLVSFEVAAFECKEEWVGSAVYQNVV